MKGGCRDWDRIGCSRGQEAIVSRVDFLKMCCLPPLLRKPENDFSIREILQEAVLFQLGIPNVKHVRGMIPVFES